MLVKDLVLMKFWLWVSSCSDVVDKRSSHLFTSTLRQNMTHSQMLGKFEYTGGPIFKVVLEC